MPSTASNLPAYFRYSDGTTGPFNPDSKTAPKYVGPFASSVPIGYGLTVSCSLTERPSSLRGVPNPTPVQHFNVSVSKGDNVVASLSEDVTETTVSPDDRSEEYAELAEYCFASNWSAIRAAARS